MHIVDTMARAYVEQKKHPDWRAYVLQVPESGYWEVERGPVAILRKGRLFGDPVNSPFMNGVMMHGGYVGCAYFFLLAIIEAFPIFFIMAGLLLLMSGLVRGFAARAMLCSIERMERFMGQVREIAGHEGMENFSAEYFGRTKGVGHGG